MKKWIVTLLILLTFTFIALFKVDFVMAAENIMQDDVILGENGFAKESKDFGKVASFILIGGLIFSGYIFYKKTK